MSSPPFGDIRGMRWCGQTNRYYAQSGVTHNSAEFNIDTSRTTELGNQLEVVRHTPVDGRLLRSLPTQSRKRGRVGSEDCSICLRSGIDQKADPRMRFLTLPCQHAFHFYCAAQWLTKRSGSCPICRAPVDTSLAVAAASAQPSLS